MQSMSSERSLDLLLRENSPVIMVTDFREERYFDGSLVNVCLMPTEEMWSRSYFILSIVVFFGFPLAILIVLYTVIAYHLMSNPGLVAPNMTSSALRYRRQVVLMLGTVVLSFFVCLLPFRAFTLCIIFASPEFLLSLGFETYQKILYFCRIMLYLNSAINPILYNLMSTKFRDGFRRLLGINEVPLLRKGTVTTTTLTTTTTSSSSRKSSFDHHLLRRSAVVRVVSIGAESNTEDSKNKRSLSKKRPNLTQNGCGNQESYV